MKAEPFVGLRPYGVADADIFFERQEEARLQVGMVLAHRVVLLFGDSGNGKSSLVNAGLVPALMKDRPAFKPERLRIVPGKLDGFLVDSQPLSFPGCPTPFKSIFRPEGESSVSPKGEFEIPASKILEQLKKRFPPAEGGQANARSEEQVLLIFDQFEELYTFVGGRAAFSMHDEQSGLTDKAKIAARDELARQVTELLRARDLPVKFLFAFREEYIVKLQALVPDLRRAAPFRLESMHADRIASVISGPFQPADPALERPVAPFARHEEAPFFIKHAEYITEGFAARSGGIGQNLLIEVQVVCLELWTSPRSREQIASLAAKKDVNGIAREIDRMIRTYFQRVIDELGLGKAAALDVLCELVTADKTRNIISRPSLHEKLCAKAGEESTKDGPPKHSKEVIDTVLTALKTSRLINESERSGTTFYDVASEALIPWLGTERETRLKKLEDERIAREAAQRAREQRTQEELAAQRATERRMQEELAAQRATERRMQEELAAQHAREQRTQEELAVQRSKEQRTQEELAVQRSNEQRAQKQKRIWIGVAILGVVLAASTSVSTYKAITNAKFANDKKTEAEASARNANQQASEARVAMDEFDKKSKLARETQERAEELSQAAQRQREEAEKQATDFKNELEKLRDEVKKLQGTQSQAAKILERKIVTSIKQNGDARIAVFGGHLGRVNQAVFSADSKFIATGSTDKRVRVWSVDSSGTALLNAPASDSAGGVRTLGFVPGTDFLITGSNGQSVRLFRWRGTPLGEIDQSALKGDTVTSIQFSPVDRSLMAIGRTGMCQLVRLPLAKDPKLWFVAGQEPVLKSWLHAPRRFVTSAAFSANGTTVVTSSDDGRTRVFGSAYPYLPIADSHNEYHQTPPPPTRGAVFSPIDERVVAWGAGTKVLHWRIGTFLRELDESPGGIGHTGEVLAVAFSPDGKLLASVGADGRCIVWDTTNGDAHEITTGIKGRLFGVDWRGANLAICGEDGGLEIWQVAATGAPDLKFAVQAHLGVAGGVCFSLDGSRVLTWSGVVEPSDVPTAKGRAATWSNPRTIEISDFTACLWDAEVAVNSGRTSRAVVAAVKPVKSAPVLIYRVKDSKTREIPTKEGLWIWLGKMDDKTQKTVECRVFQSNDRPDDSYKDDEVDEALKKLNATQLGEGQIGVGNSVEFEFGGRKYSLAATVFQAGLWKNDYLDLKLVER